MKFLQKYNKYIEEKRINFFISKYLSKLDQVVVLSYTEEIGVRLTAAMLRNIKSNYKIIE